MELNQVLGLLGYDRSPSFRPADALKADAENGHIYRKAQQQCGLAGVYTLQASVFDKIQADIPAIYVCSAASESEAALIHRCVWNQNVVPFLLVISPKNLRVYSGFNYGRPGRPRLDNVDGGALREVSTLNEIAARRPPWRQCSPPACQPAGCESH
jgi:hypothetical protein